MNEDLTRTANPTEFSTELLECVRLLKKIIQQVNTPCYDNDPPERQHPLQLILLNGDIRTARRAIAVLEDSGVL
mgnify:CR=1 FL=1